MHGEPADQPADGHALCRSGAAGTFLGVDVGGTSIKWAVTRNGIQTALGARDTPRAGHEAVLDAIASLASDLEGIDGLGIAFPGTVDLRAQRTVFIPNLPGEWTGLSVGASMAHRLGIPIAILNDGRAFGWAELSRGSAEGLANALFVTLGTGVGGAIALDGKVVTRTVDAVGEIGHVPVDNQGLRCACGGRGCLETIASATAIVAALARTVATRQSPILRDLVGDTTPTAEQVAIAARMGDPWALDAFDRAGTALGQAVAAVVLVLQLEAVVIGGGLLPAADLFLPRVRSALAERQSLTGPIPVLEAHHQVHAGALGAAVFAATRSTGHEEN